MPAWVERATAISQTPAHGARWVLGPGCHEFQKSTQAHGVDTHTRARVHTQSTAHYPPAAAQVPFRNSKLTQLLQDSLCGQAKARRPAGGRGRAHALGRANTRVKAVPPAPPVAAGTGTPGRKEPTRGLTWSNLVKR